MIMTRRSFGDARAHRYFRRAFWKRMAFLFCGTLAVWLLAVWFAGSAQAHSYLHHHHVMRMSHHRAAPQGMITCDLHGCRGENIPATITITKRHQVRVERQSAVARFDANGNGSSSRVCDASHRHCVTVASSAQPILQCVLDHVEAAGVKITALGGIRRGRCSTSSMHPCGKALDINQTRRDVRGPPRAVSNSAAVSCGAVSGSWWARSPDNGHFQVGGWAGTHEGSEAYAYAPRPRHRYAHRSRRHVADL